MNQNGKGAAYFSAAAEAGYEKAPEVFEELCRRVIGEPAWNTSAGREGFLTRFINNGGRRYIHILRRGRGAASAKLCGTSHQP